MIGKINLSRLNANIDKLSQSMLSTQSLQSAAVIGRQVLAAGHGFLGLQGGAHAVELVAQGVAGAGERPLPAVLAIGFEEEVGGVLGVGEDGDGDVDLVAEDGFEGPVRRLHARFVGIEEQDDAFRLALEQAGVLVGEGGAQGGDDVGFAGLVAGDDVGVALDEDRRAAGDDGSSGAFQAVERGGLLKEGRLGAVEVLGLILGPKLASAEGDGPAALVEDGEDQAVAEAVVEAVAGLAGDEQAGGLKGGELPAVFSGGEEQAVPSVGRVADLEGFAHRVERPSLFGEKARPQSWWLAPS